jgi:hypothetical protein
MIQMGMDWQRPVHRDFDVLEGFLIEANKVKRGLAFVHESLGKI